MVIVKVQVGLMAKAINLDNVTSIDLHEGSTTFHLSNGATVNVDGDSESLLARIVQGSGGQISVI